jgi:hypothetical protein
MLNADWDNIVCRMNTDLAMCIQWVTSGNWNIEIVPDAPKNERSHSRILESVQSHLEEVLGGLSSPLLLKVLCWHQAKTLLVSLERGQQRKYGLERGALLYFAPFSLLIFSIQRYSLNLVR